MNEVLTVILGGGQGERLFPLTQARAKPAVPLAGKYRLIDIPMSNCLHSGFNQIYVLTQFNSHSLNRHISRTYDFDMFSQGFVETLAAQQTPGDATWYGGTADAVRQNLPLFDEPGIRYILILSGDQLYRMDFRRLLAAHRRRQADLTLAVIPVFARDADRYGLLQTDPSGRIRAFVEKPREPDVLDKLAVSEVTLKGHGIDARGRTHLASMGIYLFNKEALSAILSEDPLKTDFGTEVIPEAIRHRRVFGYYFDGYWEDIGTIRAYYQASMGFLDETPKFDFYWRDQLLYIRSGHLPASHFCRSQIDRALVAEGCTLQGATIEHSIIGLRSQIGEGSRIRDSIVMGADAYESEPMKAANRLQNIPDIGIGSDCRIDRAIIDKNARIGNEVIIERFPEAYERDEAEYVVRDGIVVVPRKGILPAGTVIAPQE